MDVQFCSQRNIQIRIPSSFLQCSLLVLAALEKTMESGFVVGAFFREEIRYRAVHLSSWKLNYCSM